MTEGPRLRLFVAVDVPERHRDELTRAVAGWRSRDWGGRWTSPGGQHLTLKFLGATPETRLAEVRDVLEKIAGAHRAADVSLGGLGAFPNLRRARVLWIGIDDPAGVLAALAKELASAFEPLGWAPEAREFNAHLTLARFRTPAPLEGAIPDDPLPRLPPFSVSEVVLYQSRLHPHGARYEPLFAAPLDK